MAPRGVLEECQEVRGTSGGGVGAAPTPPTPHRKLRRPGGTQISEEDAVKRTSGRMPTHSSRQKRGVTPAHPCTPMGGGAS